MDCLNQLKGRMNVMPKMQLTKRNIDKKIPFAESGQADYFDTELKGLLLRVGKSSKTFYVQVDVKDPVTGKFKTIKEKLGVYGEIAPEQARQMAPDIIRRIREGKPAAMPIPNLQHLYERYLRDKPLTEGTKMRYTGYLPRLFASWLEIPLDKLNMALSPDIVTERFRQVREDNGPGAANNSFRCLQAIVNYAEVLYPQFVIKNPFKVLSGAKMWTKIGSRDDCLEPEQMKLFVDSLATATPVHRDCYLLALYHGTRAKEAYTLQWQHVNFEKEIVTFWHETEVSKRTYTVPMSRQSKEILLRRKQAAAVGAEYVFPVQGARGKHGHLVIRALELKRRSGLDITVHGLRRTFITIGERLRLRREDINRLTGHVDGSVTGRHYSRLTHDDMRPVLQTICNEIERLISKGIGAKVIPLRQAG
jgi:integrase